MFTLIAYRSDGSDCCRGCHMGGWSAKHELHLNINEEQLLNKIVELKSEKYYDNLDNGYEFAVLVVIDGIIYKVYGDMEYSLGEYDDENYWEKIDILETRVSEIFKCAEVKIKEQKEEIARQQNNMRIVLEQRKREEAERRELAQLAQLKAKYEVLPT